MLNNYTKPTNPKSSKNNPNQKYSHLSEDSQRFLEYCDKHGVPPIQKHIGHNPNFETRPFSNGEPYPDYFCVRFLASISYRDILAAWSIYELKDGGFLIRCDDFGKPGPYHYHLKYDSLKDLERQCMAPVEVIIEARKTLREMQQQEERDEEKLSPSAQQIRAEINVSSKVARSKQPMIGIPQDTGQTIVSIRPKKRKAKLKTEDELKELSDMLLNADRHIPTTKDNYWVSVGSW